MNDSRGVRVAGVDIGSNSTRLHIADVVVDAASGSASLSTVLKTSTVTRLAEQVDARGILVPAAIARTRNALAEYRACAREAGAVFALAIATSAVRDADNGEAFLGEIEYSYGFRAECISGEREAALAFEGITSDPVLREAVGAGRGWTLDIGGGSTEIVLADRGVVLDHHSFQIGSVRTTERFLASDPPTADELGAARAEITEMICARFPERSTPDTAIAVAGSVTTLATLAAGRETYDPEHTHLSRLTRAQVDEQLRRLASQPLLEREKIPGLEPRRAPVIVGGVLILQAALESFGIDELLVSERDILDGIAMEAARIAVAEGATGLPEPHGRPAC